MTQTGGLIVDLGERSLNRLDRRKRRTRESLIKAALGFVAEARLNVPVQEICEAADVGVGSFYNHFETKEELFQAAVNEFTDGLGALMDSLTESIEDPAEKLAARYRLTGRLFRLRPAESRIAIALGMKMILSDRGLGPRGVRDVSAASAAGRFNVADPELAMVMAAGGMLALGQLLAEQPERDVVQTTDDAAESVLKLFGMSHPEAHRISRLPIPDLTAILGGELSDPT
jgi:AcrR family transcriptional regulator